MEFKTRFKNHPPKTYAFFTEGDSLTQQQFKEECDVNNILAKYKKTGMLNHVNKHQGNFGDFASVDDYQTSLHKLMIAQQSFNQLPSELRNKFDNDPGKLIEFISDEKNTEDCYKYGLKIKPTPKDPSFKDQMIDALKTHDQSKQQK